MSRRTIQAVVAAVVGSGAVAGSVEAQTDARVAAGAAFESYMFSEPAATGLDKITLLTTPFGARFPVGGRLEVTVGGAYARGALTRPDGTESTLSGLTDTNVALTVDVVPDMLSVTAFVAAPTGIATQDADEVAVAGAIAADLLPFRITNWGTGGGLGMQVTGTRRFETFGAGLSVGYRQAGEFEPLEGNAAVYQPGDEIRVRLALDTEVGANGKGSLVVGLQRYGDDTVDQANLFRSGNRVEVTGTYAFPLGYRGSAALYGSVLHRANGTFLDPQVPESPTQDLVLFGGILRRAVGGGWLVPRLDVRMFRSEDGFGQGYVGGLGLGLELESGTTTFIPTLTGRYGSIEVVEGAESTFTGFEAGVTLRFGR